MNEICKGCLRWEKFKEKCWVYWEGKKECSLKAKTVEELAMSPFQI